MLGPLLGSVMGLMPIHACWVEAQMRTAEGRFGGKTNRCATYGRPEAEHLDGRVAAIVGRVRAGETLRFAAEWGIEWECRRRRRGVEGWGGV